MKKLLVSFLVLLGLFPVYSCNAALKLSEVEAKKIIEQELGYPILETTMARFRGGYLYPSPETQEVISFLKDNGYIMPDAVRTPVVAAGDRFNYPLTEKGQKLFAPTGFALARKVELDRFDFWLCDIYIAKQVVKSIKEVLIDSNSGIALVTFIVAKEPIEPLYSELCVKRKGGCSNLGDLLSERKVTLKKWDNGWRVQK